MPEGQRRKVLDSGVGVYALQSLVTQLAEAQKVRQEQRAKVNELLVQGRLKHQEPEQQAAQQYLDLINQAEPTAAASVMASPEQSTRLGELLAQARQARQQKADALLSLIKGRAFTNQFILPGDGQTPQPTPQPMPPFPLTEPPTDAKGIGVESLPVINRVFQVGRAAGRAIGARETQSGFQESFAAQTAAAARGFGDTANIAVAERKMIQESFERDGETYERRVSRRSRLRNFFHEKTNSLQSILAQPVPQILKGVSRSGPRYEADPALLQARRQAATDLSRLQQTQLLYEQMWKEADRVMPAIGQPTTLKGSRVGRFTVETE